MMTAINYLIRILRGYDKQCDAVFCDHIRNEYTLNSSTRIHRKINLIPAEAAYICIDVCNTHIVVVTFYYLLQLYCWLYLLKISHLKVVARAAVLNNDISRSVVLDVATSTIVFSTISTAFITSTSVASICSILLQLLLLI